jgi:endonuclease YncB( thermonuclease family)
MRWAPTVQLVVLLGVAAGLLQGRGSTLQTALGSNEPSQAAYWGQAGRVSGERTLALCSASVHDNCVVDGDTIHYAGLKIRLEDIDAPETYRHRCPAELALGQRATNRLLELINGGPFEIVRRGSRDEDAYGRKLRVIERAGRSVGDILVAEGLARRWDGPRRSWCG